MHALGWRPFCRNESVVLFHTYCLCTEQNICSFGCNHQIFTRLCKLTFSHYAVTFTVAAHLAFRVTWISASFWLKTTNVCIGKTAPQFQGCFIWIALLITDRHQTSEIWIYILIHDQQARGSRLNTSLKGKPILFWISGFLILIF